jgi:hypothetical protein
MQFQNIAALLYKVLMAALTSAAFETPAQALSGAFVFSSAGIRGMLPSVFAFSRAAHTNKCDCHRFFRKNNEQTLPENKKRAAFFIFALYQDKGQASKTLLWGA